jgi:hypothetical protein
MRILSVLAAELEMSVRVFLLFSHCLFLLYHSFILFLARKDEDSQGCFCKYPFMHRWLAATELFTYSSFLLGRSKYVSMVFTLSVPSDHAVFVKAIICHLQTSFIGASALGSFQGHVEHSSMGGVAKNLNCSVRFMICIVSIYRIEK